jgi:hypothetical protein
MFLTSSDRPIDPELKNIVEEIERKSPSFSVLAARQFRYCVSQTPVKVDIAKSRQLNILEDFIFRAGIELNPPPTEDELATVLGLDSIFIKNTTATLRNLHTLEKEKKSIKLTSVGQEFYRDRSVPKAPETKTIYAVSQPFNNNLIFKSYPIKNQEIDYLPNLTEYIAIENNLKSVSTISLSELRELIQDSDLGFHSPEDGKFVTSFNLEDITKTIWQSLSLILIFDVLEDDFRIQAREGKKVLEDASTWLNSCLTKDKTLLKTLFDFTDKENGNKGTNNLKLKLGLERLSKAEKDLDLLGLALISLHGALEDHFRYLLKSNSSVPLSKRELIFNFRQTQWKGLLGLMQRYGGLNKNQCDDILYMNKLRQEVAHGKQYAGTRSQLEDYADFVQGFIVNGT